jgi:outer membrane murein-binding lipoprotein Lpp
VGPKLVLAACLGALALAGCGTGAREADVASVVERFHAALQADDGRAACEQLSEETASKLEAQEERPCEQAILGLELPAGARVADAQVEPFSAFAVVAGGGADFLTEGPDGWKLTAAGCRRTGPDRPYDCTLEG